MTTPVNPLGEDSPKTVRPLEMGFELPMDEPIAQIQRTARQNAQARLLLIQLQWLVIVAMAAAIFWLANAQKQLGDLTETKLKVLQEFTARMNTMDDRIFAMTPSTPPEHKTDSVKNDLRLVRVQLGQAERLSAQDAAASIELLLMVRTQLSEQSTLAVPLKSGLMTAIDEDIARLGVAQNQGAWQTHIAKIQEVQSFLRSQKSQDKLSVGELALHDASMLLSLALAAATLQEKDAMVVYLNEALQNLDVLKKLSLQEDSPTDDAPITTLNQAIFALNELLANPPQRQTLKSLAMLKQSH